jgi:hypothetical protein
VTADIRGNIIGAYANISGNVVAADGIFSGNVIVQASSFLTGNALQINIPQNSSTPDPNFINCTNSTGNIFNINGRGTTILTTPVSSPALEAVCTAATGAYLSNVFRIRATAAAATTFNFINCLSDNGTSPQFYVNGRGDTVTSILVANTAVDANIFTAQALTTAFSNTAIQAVVPRVSNVNYNFFNARNSNGNLFTVDGTGAIASRMAVNNSLLNLNASLAGFANAVIVANVSARIASPAYDYMIFDSPSGRALEINGVGSIISNVFLSANGLAMFNTASAMTQDMIRLEVPNTVSGVGNYNFISCKNNAGNVFRVNGLGGTYGVGTFNTSGADYAEMFEWEDGNTTDEDRRGTTVVLGNSGMIHVANSSDNPLDIIGVVSATPSVLGDTKWNEWRGRFLTDKFGAKLSNTLYLIANVSNETDRIRCGINDTSPDGYEKIISSEFVLNPSYNPADVYVSREDRREWDAVGLVGKLRVLPDQIVNPGWKLLRTIVHSDGNTLEYLVK